jgi:hypothetical protein
MAIVIMPDLELEPILEDGFDFQISGAKETPLEY